MPVFKSDFQGYSVKFSPFEDGKLALATSQNFGIIGNGKQYVLQVSHTCAMPPKPGLEIACNHCNVHSPTAAHSPYRSRLHKPLPLLSIVVDGPSRVDGVARI